MGQLQSAMAHLKKDKQSESSDGQQIKAYHASADTPETEYALDAYDGNTIVWQHHCLLRMHAPFWDVPPPRTFPYDHFRGHDD